MAATLPSELSKVDPADAWAAWSPGSGTPWDRKWAAHLFRRAAFGATTAELDKTLADGFALTLARLLNGEPDAAARWEVLAETGRYYKDATQVRAWWLYSMLEGGHPLREKLTLFWHNHFATSLNKVRSPRLMFEQNATLRTHALGRFRPFLLAMSRDPAMLVWLDSNRNVKGAPNENYAREVMELFSLGVGNYTEKDVRAAARAFTGWHHDPEVKAFEYNAGLHDDGPKTLLGVTGALGGDDAVRIACDQPACGRFLAGKLYAFLVSETPPPEGLLDPLAERFRASDYDIAALVKTMLGSRLFFSDHAYRKRVKWPVEYALGALRGLVPGRLPPSDLVEPLSKMGQSLFAPPNVKGWRTGTDWLNSATLLARNNFAEAVAMGSWSKGGSRPTNGLPDAAEVATAEAVVEADIPAPLAPVERIPPQSVPTRGPGGAAVAGPAAVLTAEVAGSAAKPPPAPPPPAPPADRDVLAVVFAGKPATVPAVVRAMGVALFGDAPPPAAAKKIEAYLLDGKKAPAANEMNAPAFRHRAREALHAMMCLPEYQLS